MAEWSDFILTDKVLFYERDMLSIIFTRISPPFLLKCSMSYLCNLEMGKWESTESKHIHSVPNKTFHFHEVVF